MINYSNIRAQSPKYFIYPPIIVSFPCPELPYASNCGAQRPAPQQLPGADRLAIEGPAVNRRNPRHYSFSCPVLLEGSNFYGP